MADYVWAQRELSKYPEEGFDQLLDATILLPDFVRHWQTYLQEAERNHDRFRQNCSVVLKYGMKRDFNAWLATLGGTAPVKTLAELRAWNTAHQSRGAIKYGQANLDVSDEMDLDEGQGRAGRPTARRTSASAAPTASTR